METIIIRLTPIFLLLNILHRRESTLIACIWVGYSRYWKQDLYVILLKSENNELL